MQFNTHPSDYSPQYPYGCYLGDTIISVNRVSEGSRNAPLSGVYDTTVQKLDTLRDSTMVYLDAHISVI